MSDLKLEGRKKPVKTISHGGGINGFATLITRDTEREILVVVLNNVVPTNSATITKEIFEILYSK